MTDDPVANGRSLSVPAPLWIALGILGLIVSITAVPGVFTPDDNNYLVNVLALRQGRVTIANTEGLPPSRELLFFDPGPWARAVDRTPVASTAPPLYAPLALPFSVFRWRGLVALNTLAFLATTLVVFIYAARYSAHASTAWLAATAFALGGFVIEYAQGLWPHALSVALCAAGVIAAGVAIDGAPVRYVASAGFLLALATGVRYQNAVLLPTVGLAILLLMRRRRSVVVSLLVFVLAAAIPLAASSAINKARLDSWNPVSKGKGYIRVALLQDAGSSVFDPLVMGYALVVDYSARPPLVGRHTDWVTHDPVTGAHLMLGVTLKKALVQSSPWIALALLAMVMAWLPGVALSEVRRRQLRLLSLTTAAVLATFAFGGVHRYDGLAFNQRYLLELLPFLAVAFAWGVDGLTIKRGPLLVGAVCGVGVVMIVLASTPILGGPEVWLWRLRQVTLLKFPLLLSAGLLSTWLLVRFRADQRYRTALACVAGGCLGWGLALHLADDVLASHALRGYKRSRTAQLARVLPDHSAFVAYWAHKDAAVPLLFDRDIVILDAMGDDGEDAPALISQLLREGRRVFVLEDGFPPAILDRVMTGLVATRIDGTTLQVRELREAMQ